VRPFLAKKFRPSLALVVAIALAMLAVAGCGGTAHQPTVGISISPNGRVTTTSVTIDYRNMSTLDGAIQAAGNNFLMSSGSAFTVSSVVCTASDSTNASCNVTIGANGVTAETTTVDVTIAANGSTYSANNPVYNP
jgi:hypothetical protein